MSSQKFSLIKRMQSFTFAFNGIKLLLREEHNSRIHLFIAACAITAGGFLNLSGLEWIAIVFAIGFVIVMEIINTSIENIADFISPDRHEKIKIIKDLSAAAVLISVLTAVAVGTIVFLPKILELC